MDCIFCKIAAGEIPSHKVYDDGLVMAFLDIAPVNPGHVLVVPKEHFSSLLEMPDDLLCRLAQTARKIAPAVLEAVGAKDFNLSLNDGEAAGQVVKHFHWHLMPRFKGDGHELWHGRAYGPGEAESLLAKIKENMPE